MKQFNLEEYLANPSRKVITRDGRNVRIICTDAKGKHVYSVIALITEVEGEDNEYEITMSTKEWETIVFHVNKD